ncbi:hypothetical protein WUBG_00865 [Wuchereria bancrofti]|uniref:Uncharacterized protein n=1 Tax=Wuchereria bancrofti TaxID=6293 RepID=J9F156_WUCBA|nr:hypothetical protein WUBG_00865 [Wuchereria bancrofti]VDM08068.1 unnamed protein product [Wuchereria bancrofti]
MTICSSHFILCLGEKCAAEQNCIAKSTSDHIILHETTIYAKAIPKNFKDVRKLPKIVQENFLMKKWKPVDIRLSQQCLHLDGNTFLNVENADLTIGIDLPLLIQEEVKKSLLQVVSCKHI